MDCDAMLDQVLALRRQRGRVSSQGFELKVALFVIASSLNCYLNL
jgi:hypothetical protein